MNTFKNGGTKRKYQKKQPANQGRVSKHSKIIQKKKDRAHKLKLLNSLKASKIYPIYESSQYIHRFIQ